MDEGFGELYLFECDDKAGLEASPRDPTSCEYPIM